MYKRFKNLCPKCKGDISHMDYTDAIRQEETHTEIREVNIFLCPHCNKEFDDMEVIYEEIK